MAEPVQPRGIMDQLVLALGLITVVSGAIAFFVLIPGVAGSMTAILGINTSSYFILAFTPTPSMIWAAIIATAVLVAISLISIFPGQGARKLTGDTVDDVYGFFRYLAIFVFIQLVISIFGRYISPGFGDLPVYNEAFPVQNFFFSVGAVFQTVMLQFVPLAIMIGIYLAISGKFNLRALINPNAYIKEYKAVFVIIATAVAALFFSDTVGDTIIAYLTFLVLNAIYLRYGFFRSLIAGFAISEFNIVTGLAGSIPYLPTVLSIYLFIWAFFGLIVVFEYFSRETARKRSEEMEKRREELPALERSYLRVDPDRLFIRSSCPECGRAVFHIRDNMTLVCEKCEHELSRDAVGEYNIRIEGRYPGRI